MPSPQEIQQLLLDLIEDEVDPGDRTKGPKHLVAQVRNRMHAALCVDEELRALFPPAPGRPATTSAGERSFPDVTEPTLPGYVISEILGRGGVGIVYKAADEALGRDVAIKMVLLGQYATEPELDALCQEARAVAALSHPNIVQVYQVGRFDGLPYLVMEYLPGGTLAGQLAGRPMPTDQAARLTATLARAVHAAHERGVVHRDLKPANILLASDGTPKLADFSLARHTSIDRRQAPPPAQVLAQSAEESLEFRASAAFGTPSYMAPEQVRGTSEAFEAAVDVYALGVILYESLTGRPPFVAATASQTHQLVLTTEPSAARTFNASVPRDLEAICQRCLQKSPSQRYHSALALAEDLERFARGEPVSARPIAIAERLAKVVMRRPVAAIGVAAVIVCLTVISAMSASRIIQTNRAVAATVEDLGQAEESLRHGKWPAARAALERAKARSGGLSEAPMAARLRQVDRQLVLIDQLDSIRSGQFALSDERTIKRRSASDVNELYLSRLQDAGIVAGVDPVSETPAAVAARIVDLPTKTFVLGLLDDWAACQPTTGDSSRLAWIFEVARAVDGPSSDWRSRVRSVEAWNSKQALSALAEAASVEREPPNESLLALLLAVAQRFDALGADPGPLLQRLQQAAPGNFYVNHRLGISTGKADPKAAVRFFQAAVSIRPEHALARCNLGVALAMTGQVDEAINQLETAATADPRSALIQSNLGNALSIAARVEEAARAYGRATELDPRYTPALTNLARLLMTTGQPMRASELFERAIEIDPTDGAALTGLGLLRHRSGRTDEGLEYCRRAVELDPSNVAARVNLAVILSALGDRSRASEQLRAALRLDPRDVGSQVGLADALLSFGRPGEARDLYSAVLRVQPTNAMALHGLGSIAGMEGDHATAILHFKDALRTNPNQLSTIGALGNALFIEAEFAQALPLLKRYRDAKNAGDETNLRLIDQCEHLLTLAPRLPQVLQGGDSPADAEEALAFAHLARGSGEPAHAAKLFDAAFQRDPRLAADLRAANRYLAARCAARAVPLSADPSVQRSLRQLSRSWLAEDLADWQAVIQSGNPTAPAPARRLFARWKIDPDLTAIRDPVGLASAGAEEQTACLALWKDIDDALVKLTGPKRP